MNPVKYRRRASSQRGIALVWTMLSLSLLVGFSAYVIDIGTWLYIRSELKRVADAAALAYAYSELHSVGVPDTYARNYVSYNNETFVGDAVTGNEVTVTVSLPKPVYFSWIYGQGSGTMYASATAEWRSIQSGSKSDYGVGTTAAYNYSAFGPQAYHQYGDEYDTKYLTNGSLNPNYASYPALGGDPGYKGEYFGLTIPSDYTTHAGTSKFTVELFDPETMGTGTNQNNYDPLGLGGSSAWSIDEWRPPQQGSASWQTNTWYTIQYQDSTGAWDTATNAAGTAATTEYNSQTWAEGQWIQDPNLTIDTSASQYQVSGALTSFRLVATTTNPALTNPIGSDTGLTGSSENGFNLRVGPPEQLVTSTLLKGVSNPVMSSGASPSTNTTPQTDEVVTMGEPTTTNSTSGNNPFVNSISNETAAETLWQNDIGNVVKTGVAAEGHIEVNFNSSSSATIDLGQVPADAAGGNLAVTRFDTDVGTTSSSISYYWVDDSGVSHPITNFTNGGGWGGAGNDTQQSDTVPIPSSYAPTTSGGNHFYASYAASANDTSDWSVSLSIPGNGTISLVGTPGRDY